MPTRQQQLARRAYDAVSQKKASPVEADYARVCMTFPALIHNSGLCQAVAFAEARDRREGNEFGQYLNDLAVTLGIEAGQLSNRSRSDGVLSYQHLTQDALAAASWMKRYAESLLKDERNSNKAGNDESDMAEEG